MKTMGLSKLYLVDPACEVDSHASALAAGATDVLGNAVIVDTVADAIARLCINYWYECSFAHAVLAYG